MFTQHALKYEFHVRNWKLSVLFSKHVFEELSLDKIFNLSALASSLQGVIYKIELLPNKDFIVKTYLRLVHRKIFGQILQQTLMKASIRENFDIRTNLSVKKHQNFESINVCFHFNDESYTFDCCQIYVLYNNV